MPRTPPDIVYDVDDVPPAPTLVMLGLQHVFVIAISLILPVLISREAGLSDNEAAYFVSMSMLASGIGTCLQAWKYKDLVGSGYLCPCVCGPSYLSSSVLAVKNGGLSLLFGMTALAGVFQIGLSRVIGRLRVLFPVEVTGVVVIMVGISIIPFTLPLFLSIGITNPDTADKEILVAIVTFAIILCFTIWGKGLGKLFPALIGIVVGYLLSAALGIIDISTYQTFEKAPLFAIPDFSYFGVSFSPALFIPFVVATICSSFKNVGDISICQKAGDLEWKRPDFSTISNGILSDGITTTVGGLCGGVGQSSSSANIGLALATRAISRYIAFAAGGILIFLALFPKIATVFLVMPSPVMGAALVYMGGFMIVAGLGILTSRMIDARKTFVIGVSLMFGIGAYILPDAFSNMDPLISPLFESGLAIATLLAIALNLIVRIGVGKEETLVVSAQDYGADRIFAYMERAGETFGARREVIAEASHAVSQTCDALIDFGRAKSEIRITTRFDDLNLDITIQYHGDPLPLPTHCPSEKKFLEDDTLLINVTGFIIRNYADSIQSTCKNGDCTISIHFDH